MPNLFKSIFVAVQSSRTQRVGQINARSTEIRRDLTSAMGSAPGGGVEN